MIIPFFISHQGCRHRCIFCDQRAITGTKENIPSPEEIVAKIVAYTAASSERTVEVAFYGGSFTCLPRQMQTALLMPLRPFLADETVTSVRISTRPDAVDHLEAAFLFEMGVRTVELGVQSMDDDVLDRARRGHSSEDVETAFRLLQSQGLKTGAQLIPGLPGESFAGALSSLARVLTLNPSCVRIYPALVLSGTELADLYLRGEYQPMTLDECVQLCKRMLVMCRQAGVPVLRVGLQPTDALMKEGAILAGPFHPALRQLVEGELYYDLIAFLSATIDPGTHVDLICSSGKISDVVGQHRRNIRRLEQEKGVRVVSVQPESRLSEGELEIRSANRIFGRGSVLGSPMTMER